MINSQLIDILRCPTCGQPALQPALTPSDDGQQGTLDCAACQNHYKVQEDIPNLIPEKRLDGDQWNLWKDHLELFFSRRKFRTKNAVPSQGKRWAEKMEAFGAFVDISEGAVLDVGCGPGMLRTLLDEDQVTYFGVDPLPDPEVTNFPFALAVAEYLPFKDDTFNCVIVRSALDHFCDLDAFLLETRRVLKPGGHLFLEQVIHDVKGPVSAAKALVHTLKDFVDDVKMHEKSDAPKHMNEFTRGKVMKTIANHFDIERSQEYDRNWYTPTQLFLALKPKD